MNDSTCKTCGKKIAFGKLPSGRTIPLDLVAPTYFLTDSGNATRSIPTAYVSHFATCPQASEHSKRKKE